MRTENGYHRMPFGAHITEDQRVRFRLWAPDACRVDVCIKNDSDHKVIAMLPEKDGWFEVITGSARAGSLYSYCIDGDKQIPDPASRFQPRDVHGPSEVINANAWQWQDENWFGRPFEEAIIYELHVGCFTPQGRFTGVIDKLDYLSELGITVIELMPIADFPGQYNWGYDGVSLFAPDSRYGRPEDLKALIDAAHARNLMVFLDVVYNHFGPEGNYLHGYAPQFFSKNHQTPWGAAINFDGEQSYWVRQFFIHNALYWLTEYHFDGLRLDAVHAIQDNSQPDFLTQLAQSVQRRFADERHVHLILENDHNAAHYLTRDHADRPKFYVAQWNDDIHHSLHVLMSGESRGYYVDYVQNPVSQLGRCLTEGFAYQGEQSVYRGNRHRGENSSHLPLTAFISFLQNHDQIGNRALGERIARLARPEQIHAAISILLLAPQPPLLFMGEEWYCTQPFLFFCDFGPDLASQVVTGRREMFACFPEFSSPDDLARIPDPMDVHTFQQAVLNWDDTNQPDHLLWLNRYRRLINLRHREIIPHLKNLASCSRGFEQLDKKTLTVYWNLDDYCKLTLFVNLGDNAYSGYYPPPHTILYSTFDEGYKQSHKRVLPPWSAIWCLEKH